jgi:homoserine dehydrogenase
MKQVRIGLLGCGTVGSGFVGLVEHERDRIRSRYGVDLSIGRILVRDVGKERSGAVDRTLLTDCALDVLDDGCDLIVELVGGVHSAGSYVRRAIANRRNVVTANKALLACSGGELFASAAACGVRIGFEASVCGGVPVIGALRRGLAGDSIESVTGILNGTSNYVLSRMEDGLTFTDALALAQASGFAEADPSLDVDGEDAAQKLAILAELAFHAPVRKTSVTGIRGVTLNDIVKARARGEVVRSIAEARRVAGGVELRVEPRCIAKNDALASVRDEQNAVIVRGRAVGEIVLSGKGAGSLPTAAAVLADVIELAAA